MALFKFIQAILAGELIRVFIYGNHRRDFTYIDDIVERGIRSLDKPAKPNPEWTGRIPDPVTNAAPYRVYDIGTHRAVELMRNIEVLEETLGKKAEKSLLPLQPGDVPNTYADVGDLKADISYEPTTPVEVGVARFVAWYRVYYQV